MMLKKKSFRIVLSLILIFVLAVPTFAQSTIPANDEIGPSVVSQSANLKNANANDLWDAAVAKAKLEGQPVIKSFNNMLPTPRAYTTLRTSVYAYIPNTKVTVDVLVTAAVNTGTTISGTPTIGQVYSVSAAGLSTDTTVTVNHSQYTIIDQGRVLACNLSCIVGTDFNRAVTIYVELNANGQGYGVMTFS